jgi:hypothetical protein
MPRHLIVVDRVAAREYLTDPKFSENRRSRVFNLCRSYGYQTVGYYVSLLATARGHKPLPSVIRFTSFANPRSCASSRRISTICCSNRSRR